MTPLVTIVTVAFNSEATICKTIESVLQQDYSRIEYLIIDGKSTDGTIEIANQYREKFETKGYKYQIISEPDHGIYDAMNKGIKRANGDYIGLINSDDWYETNAVSITVSEMLTKDCDITFADIWIHRNEKSAFIKKAALTKFETSRHWNHPTMFVRADMYKKFPFWELSVHDDYGCYLEMKRAGAKISTIAKPLAHFKMGGASNRKSIKFAITRIKSRFACYSRNGYSRWYLCECILMEIVKMILG